MSSRHLSTPGLTETEFLRRRAIGLCKSKGHWWVRQPFWSPAERVCVTCGSTEMRRV